MAPHRQHAAGMFERIARRRRDSSLARVGSVTRAIAVTTVAAVGALGLYVAKALPGHGSTAAGSTQQNGTGSSGTGSSGTGAPTTSAPSSSAGSSASSPTTLSPPTTAPISNPGPAPVVSGSS